jgi:hypothetical protein
MSQFTLTTEEDALVITALRNKATQYSAMFGSSDPALDALIAKVEGQLTPVAQEVQAVEEKPVKAKKSKAE